MVVSVTMWYQYHAVCLPTLVQRKRFRLQSSQPIVKRMIHQNQYPRALMTHDTPA